MQRTVIHESIDGYEIVKGFGEATIDMIATIAGAQSKILALDELIQLNNLKAKIQAQANIANSTSSLAKNAAQIGNTSAYNTYNAQYTAAVAAITSLSDELPELVATYDAARTATIEANAVYCLPDPKSEQSISETDYTALKASFDALKANTKLQLAGGIVADFRDVTYWNKADGAWTSVTITTLGVSIPDEGIKEAELTEAQKVEITNQTETARVAALTDAEKYAEATAAQSTAKAKVVSVQGEVAAGITAQEILDTAVTAYKTTLVKINSKFSTSLT